MSPGTVPLMAVVLAGSHPRPSPVALPRAPSLAVPAWLVHSKASAQRRSALPVLVSQLSSMPQLWLAISGCGGSRTGSPLISLGGKGASGSELRKAEQSHWCGWECLAWLLSISVALGDEDVTTACSPRDTNRVVRPWLRPAGPRSCMTCTRASFPAHGATSSLLLCARERG